MQDSRFNLMQQPSGALGVEMWSRELGFWKSRKRLPTGSARNYPGVIVVHRARIVEIVGLLRDAMVRMHLRGLTQTERAQKRDQIYEYNTSEAYRQHQAEAQRLTTDILDLDVEEQRTHGKVWQARGKIATRLRNAVREIDTEVSAILEGRTSHTC